MELEEITRKDWYYILYRSPDGLLLTEAEVARYRADEGYLDELAAAIRYSPETYRARWVR